MHKQCQHCKKEKILEAFYTFRTRRGETKRRNVCKECDKRRIAKWQKNHAERSRRLKLASYHRRKHVWLPQRRERYANDPEYKAARLKGQKEYKKSGRALSMDRARKKRNKDAAFAAYGGYKCQKCKIEDKDVLNIDHIGGRKNHGHAPNKKGDYLYSWLKTHGYPSGFRVLCFNCNIKVHRMTNPSKFR